MRPERAENGPGRPAHACSAPPSARTPFRTFIPPPFPRFPSPRGLQPLRPSPTWQRRAPPLGLGRAPPTISIAVPEALLLARFCSTWVRGDPHPAVAVSRLLSGGKGAAAGGLVPRPGSGSAGLSTLLTPAWILLPLLVEPEKRPEPRRLRVAARPPPPFSRPKIGSAAG